MYSANKNSVTLSGSGITAIYAGTFDPITFGHIDIIKRSSPMFASLIIGVADATGKATTFSFNERTRIVTQEIEDLVSLGYKNVSCTGFSGLLVKFAKNAGASVIIRGLRVYTDFEYEFQMACMNARLDKDIKTIFMPTSESTQFISSRFVKQIAALGGDISSLVSPRVEKELNGK